MKNASKPIRIAAATSLLAVTTLAPVSASANPCAGQQAGCVLPVEAPVVAAPVETAVVAESGGIGWLLPALLAAAAIVGAILLLDDDDDPISV